MLDDLFTLSTAPANWQKLSASHLEKLIQHWQKKGLKPSTIMNYMTIIRRFLQFLGHDLSKANNLSFGLRDKNTTPKTIHLIPESWLKLSNPVARVLMGLQMHFGLTLSESMRLIPDVHAQHHHLLLTREMTFNHQDRKIPIETTIQRTIIQEFNQLTKRDKSLIGSYGYRVVCFYWQNAMKSLRWPPNKSYRYFYAKLRKAQLKFQMSAYKLNLLIMDEMGLKSRTTLWSYLNEQ